MVLVISSNKSYYSKICEILSCDAIRFQFAATAGDALKQLSDTSYSLVIIRAPFEDCSLLELVKDLHMIRRAPILIIHPPQLEMPRIELLDAGVSLFMDETEMPDYYISQLKALARLQEESLDDTDNKSLIFGLQLIIVPSYHLVRANGHFLNLTNREFQLLYFFATHERQVLSRRQIYESVWDNNVYFSGDDAVKSCIKSLRKKLSSAKLDCIQNIHGVGYRFVLKR